MEKMSVWITHGLLRDCAEHKQGLSLGLFTIPLGLRLLVMLLRAFCLFSF